MNNGNANPGSMGIENRYSAAREKLFATHPWEMVAIEAVSVNLIEACGMTIDEYRGQQRCVVFAKAAKTRGLDVDEFVIRLMANLPEQAQAWRLERQRKGANVLGIDWDEYKQLNRITG